MRAITLSAQQVEIRDATHAVVRFHQRYSSPTVADETDKVLEWELIDGRWLIVKELANPALTKVGSVKDAVNAWKSAWVNGDTPAFDMCYSTVFVASNGVSRDEWITQEMRKSAFQRSKGMQWTSATLS